MCGLGGTCCHQYRQFWMKAGCAPLVRGLTMLQMWFVSRVLELVQVEIWVCSCPSNTTNGHLVVVGLLYRPLLTSTMRVWLIVATWQVHINGWEWAGCGSYMKGDELTGDMNQLSFESKKTHRGLQTWVKTLKCQVEAAASRGQCVVCPDRCRRGSVLCICRWGYTGAFDFRLIYLDLMSWATGWKDALGNYMGWVRWQARREKRENILILTSKQVKKYFKV